MAKESRQQIAIRFNAKLYNKKHILKAISAFSNLATFNTELTNNYLLVKISGIDKKFKKILSDEFSNYVLELNATCL